MTLVLKYTFLFFSVLFGMQLYAQDSLNVKTTRLSESELIAGESYVIDTIVDGKVFFKKSIEPIKEIDLTKELQDHEMASEFDKKWMEELYSTSLFDTIYREVTDLKYEAVYYPELSTDTLKARLERLNARTPFNVEYNPQLENLIKRWLKNRHQSMERLMGLSKYYFPMFERELDNYNIPLEMKYLAIVESALKPRAKSRVGATGLWQFMFATGKQYGLDVSSYVDERSDPIKSTKSASIYLAKLYEIFGDWDLALAAYNSGPGNVSKAIRRSGGYRNYWNIRPNLPRETAGYVPAFLATMYIFEYAKEHGFIQHKPQFNYVETDTIHVKQMITLDQVSEFTGVKMEVLQFLNPSYKLDVIPYIKGKNYTLRLPRDVVGTFVNNEKDMYAFAKAEFDKREKPLPKLLTADTKTRYKVKQGDYLGKIARKFGVRVSQLKQWNGLRSNNLKIGQRLTVYPRNPSAITKAASKPKSTANFKGKTYTVKSGDSLWSISQKFSGVSVQDIKNWNDISGTNLKIGMTLRVSKS
ncbi:membrane-bound lytic murein transglycosylase D [Lacinutrix venerupis]|uniref:LysM peptidoglycan-binding domain-containing protein n=1 Tax=Lacinutrix venerupis TaxID=1486034 RepID=UPI000EB4C666|nr:LysM peptidoglycan-binding domain-containing protein [Lacinutrix venerupis]RLJ63325.1 membrane-bound lytic murein transglycosylase D [Lacinutrix venerupis]